MLFWNLLLVDVVFHEALPMKKKIDILDVKYNEINSSTLAEALPGKQVTYQQLIFVINDCNLK